MAIKTSNSGGDFEKAPEGMHMARCVRIIDCGTHLDEKWKKMKRIGWLFFELPNALMEPNEKNERKPFMVGKRYTLSHNEKALLRLDLESWYGKQFSTIELDSAGGFDLEKLLGRPAMINVVYSEGGKYANIRSINPLPVGMECPKQINPTFSFGITEIGTEKFKSLSERMQKFILESQEAKGPSTKPDAHTPPPDFEEDIPF